MRISKYPTDFLFCIIILLCLSGSHFISSMYEKPAMNINKQQSSFNINDKFWSFFHLGQKRLVSSLYWIATILESDHEHYKGNDLNSWMFLRFNTISNLEPMFYENYAFGGPYLSIVKDDLEGASVIYNKGLEKYPDDFAILRDAGFHFYFEVGDYERAYEIYKKLVLHKKSNPLIVSALARLETSKGNLEEAFHILKDKYDSIQNSKSILLPVLRENLYALKAEIDLNCLNNKGQSCALTDLNGNEYIKNKENKFEAKEKWTPMRIKKRAPRGP